MNLQFPQAVIRRSYLDFCAKGRGAFDFGGFVGDVELFDEDVVGEEGILFEPESHFVTRFDIFELFHLQLGQKGQSFLVLLRHDGRNLHISMQIEEKETVGNKSFKRQSVIMNTDQRKYKILPYLMFVRR